MREYPLISVIVPIYKVKKYLDKCVDSIVKQSYQNLEIILVDDGSPDECPAMCDAWAQRDSRIRVIHKKNGGLSDARNAGMAIATGELIGFVDSDDWIREDMYELLYNNMIEFDSDISVCGMELIFEDGSPSRALTRQGCCVLETEAAMSALIDESWLKQPVVQKLYKAPIAKSILFPVGKYHEDVFWTYQAIGKAKRVSVFDSLCYFYNQHSGSIMGSVYSIKRLDSVLARQMRAQYISEYFPNLQLKELCNLWFSCMYLMQMMQMHCDAATQRKATDMISETIKKHPITLKNAWRLGPKQSFWIMMAKISFLKTCRFRTMLGIGV